MQLLMVGGHSRSVGKTALVEDLIRAFPEAGWTAIKITQYGHDLGATSGKGCECAPREGLAPACTALDEEFDRGGRTGTSRFLAAGARRVLWLRTRQGALAQSMPLLLHEMRRAGNVILESNSLVEFLDPTLYLVCLEPERTDFKSLALHFLGRADAFVLRSPLGSQAWPDVPLDQIERKPRFVQRLGAPLPAGLLSLVAARFTLPSEQAA